MALGKQLPSLITQWKAEQKRLRRAKKALKDQKAREESKNAVLHTPVGR